jgi:hypothetical protein
MSSASNLPLDAVGRLLTMPFYLGSIEMDERLRKPVYACPDI